MTARELARLLLRRWRLTLGGLALTLGGLALVLGQPALHWTQFNVVLLPPTTSQEAPNKLADGPYQLAQLAGVLMTDVNEEVPLVMASSDTTLFGEGVRSGVQVRSPNRGTQWRALYSAAHLDVQVVDSSPEAVAARADDVVRRLELALARRQDAVGVRPRLRVTLLAAPADPVVVQVAGSRPRAVAGTGLAGLCATVALVYWAERWRLRRFRGGQGRGGDS